MAIYAITTSLGSFTEWASFTSGDTLIVTQNATWASLGYGFFSADLHVLFAGTVLIGNLTLISANGSIDVMDGGSVTSTSKTSFALEIGNGTTLSNGGTVTGVFGAITSNGNSALGNSGTISARDTAVEMTDELGRSGTLANSGLISSRGVAAVSVTGGTVDITNSGRIEATRSIGSGDSVGISAGDHNLITNSGSIHGNSIGIAADKATALDTTLTNDGSISGTIAAYLGGEGLDLITNHGSFSGGVFLGGGTDRFLMWGGTADDVDLGAGNDIYKDYQSTLRGTVTGGSGADSYYTDDTHLTIIEANIPADIDTVYARTSFALASFIEVLTLQGTGDYRGFGNSGANTMNGNAGDNRLSGLAGNDSLQGGEGDDVLLGAAGADTAKGDGGDDVLLGGLGKDYLVGGADADTFRFTTLAQSAATQINADVIADFSAGEDHIDLSAIDAVRVNQTPDDAFRFIGAAAFSGSSGQLRYVITAGVTYIQMDVNGDAVADSMIKLSTAVALNAADFVL